MHPLLLHSYHCALFSVLCIRCYMIYVQFEFHSHVLVIICTPYNFQEQSIQTAHRLKETGLNSDDNTASSILLLTRSAVNACALLTSVTSFSIVLAREPAILANLWLFNNTSPQSGNTSVSVFHFGDAPRPGMNKLILISPSTMIYPRADCETCFHDKLRKFYLVTYAIHPF